MWWYTTHYHPTIPSSLLISYADIHRHHAPHARARTRTCANRNPDSQIYIDFAFIACGLGMLVGTNTLVWCANIYPDESVFDNDVTPDHSRWEHVKFTLKVVVSMMSQNCLWLGMYDLLENYYSGGSLGYIKNIFKKLRRLPLPIVNVLEDPS